MILSEEIRGSIPNVQCLAIALTSSDSIGNGGNIPAICTKV